MPKFFYLIEGTTGSMATTKIVFFNAKAQTM